MVLASRNITSKELAKIIPFRPLDSRPANDDFKRIAM